MTTHHALDDNVADCFRSAMRNFPATVSILTAHVDGRDHGMTATAVCSVSMQPPSLMVCLGKQTLLHDMLLEGSKFAVNVLGADDQDMSNAFSGGVPPEERFNVGGWTRDASGLMVLDRAPAVLVCRRKAAMPFGSHTLFIGEVQSALTDQSAATLVYANAAYCGVQPLEAM